MSTTLFSDIVTVQTIVGQVRHRRRLTKSLFFIDIQPTDPSSKSQIFFRSDDNTGLDDFGVVEAYRSCHPGNVVSIQVREPSDSNEQKDKEYKVWQSDKPATVVVPYTSRNTFTQDRPLGSTKANQTIEAQGGMKKIEKEKPEKSKLNCKYWINSNACVFGDKCMFQHPIGTEFEEARKEWVEERIKRRKLATHDPNDPHTSKMPSSLRAIIFADWIRHTFATQLKSGSVLDVAGGKGDVSMVLTRSFGIPSTVVEPKERKHTKYWLKRLRHLVYRLEVGSFEQPDWRSKEIQIALKSWPYDIEPQYMHTFLNDEFLEKNTELLSTVTLFVGLHSDEATIPIVDAALKARKAFAVVPCCVFSHDNQSRKLKSGELVTTTEQLIQYICEKNTGEYGGVIQKDYLGFEGKNVVVYWIPDIQHKAT